MSLKVNAMRKENELTTYCQIDLKAIKANLEAIRKVAQKNTFSLPTRPKKTRKLGGTDIMPVIKADAYGHGMQAVAGLLSKSNVGFLGVSDVSEGIALRKQGIKKPILLFESTLKDFSKQIIHYRLMPTICN